MHKLLSKIDSPSDLRELTASELDELAAEIRESLCSLVATRSAHFASNLGVVELCLALHTAFDFSQDRLIWDTGHQTYPHKLVTGRYDEFGTIRTKGGLMGYPNPAESPFDLFMTGHAGCSVSTALGLRSGDQLLDRNDRHAVAVIGDGAFVSGIVSEAMNHAGGMGTKMLVVLNDNMMSICPRVGSLGDYLDRLRANPFYTGLKNEVVKILNHVPLLGDPVERFLAQMKEAVKAGVRGGMLFEDLGFRYLGPIDGHNIRLMRKYFEMFKEMDAPTLLHVVTSKGHGFQPAEENPTYFHTPPALGETNGETNGAALPDPAAPSTYTNVAREAVLAQMRADERVTIMTAAMCQGNKLEPVREEFPDRFFDTGICESHAVVFAAGQAKAGMRPIVDVYSTFMQRSFDQIFQEVSLQNLPVTLMMDRAGLTGPDGPTHHGSYDLAFMRLFPNITVMAPGDAYDLKAMVGLAIAHDGPCSIRYPKAAADTIEGSRSPVELGRAEVLTEGADGTVLCCGSLLSRCAEAVKTLAEDGIEIGLINARFVKPLDRETILETIRRSPTVITVEEGVLCGGFGSAVLEAANAEGLETGHVKTLGLPDRFVPHGTRSELLADLGLDATGIANTCRQAANRVGQRSP